MAFLMTRAYDFLVGLTISFGDNGEGSRLDDVQSELTIVKR